ncbi:MAG: hypothetical protein B6240_07545 [Desulfobacteraceae bacterium 4572_87]|nr:MAG: hypothetical protein B6240_07545 [Desulfobacteraceae bacterium 4572_87]
MRYVRFAVKLKIGIGCVLLFVLLVFSLVTIYPDWLWFENLGLGSVFRTMILTRFGFGAAVWIFLILIIAVNLHVARRLSPAPGPGSPFKDGAGYAAQIGLSVKTLNMLFLALILIASFVLASKGSVKWDLVLRYLYQEPFGSNDPVFGRDMGFYVFALPFYVFIRSGLMVLVLFAAGLTIIWYLKNGALQIEGEIAQVEGHPPSLPKFSVAPGVGKHLAFLAGIMVLLLSWGYQLKIYGLLYSTQGPAFGASFTDVHIKVWAYRAVMALSLCFAVLLFINAFKPAMKRLLIGGAIWVGSVLVLTIILPMAIQKVVVKPNEFAKESQYISHNIAYTREAYNLNKIKKVNFQVNEDLSLEEMKQQRATMQNIRIWDERPLLKTYQQIQSIRLYYDFNNVDVDRYMINGQYRQLMLAARELVVKKLPAQANTWVNRHLTYTHGYGLAASPVNEVTREGLPQLFIKDLPPVSEAGLEKILRPEIYYGEMTDQYVLVKTTSKEFDFPKGDKNVYSVYQGRGGVPINSFVRRFLYAVSFRDPQIFFTNYLTSESRIMYNRRIKRRVKAIAPFLSYDQDPYLVLSKGNLYWILDAYTTSNMYPYSTRSHSPFDRGILNYIRNSVKVTIDAYNGDVNFYRLDDKDPIARAYSRIFPDLFKPFSDMPEDLKRHIRYPKDFFHIQADTYTRYHMEDVQVFYNQEDLWQLPDEMYGDSRQKMEPYYIIIKLPEGEKEEFLLMLPFTPSKKDNMIGWLAARSDLSEYGSLIVYKLPKEKLVYGPMQIEARVDQQTDISRELSLWDQKGSRVIRGNLLAIPVLDAFVYVEPIYLEAKQEDVSAPATGERSAGGLQKLKSKLKPSSSVGDPTRAASLPELKRVIVAFGNQVAMERNLDLALSRVLGKGTSRRKTDAPAATKFLETSDLGRLALEYYNRAKEDLRRGDWAGYGENLEGR